MLRSQDTCTHQKRGYCYDHVNRDLNNQVSLWSMNTPYSQYDENLDKAQNQDINVM